MLNRTDILSRGAAALSAATLLAALAAPSQAADEPSAASDAGPAAQEVPADSLPAEAARGTLSAAVLELAASRITEQAGILGDPAHRELSEMLDTERAGAHGSALGAATGGGDSHRSFEFLGSLGVGDESDGVPSLAEDLASGSDPAELMRGFALAHDSQTNADHDTGASYRPSWGKRGFPQSMGPSGSSTDGTRIGEGAETTRTDVGKKGKSAWKIIYSHEAPCSTAPLCMVTTVFYADGQQEVWRHEMGPDGSTNTETKYDQDGNIYWELVQARGEDGEILYETVNGEPVDDGSDEQPLPEGGSEPARKNCFGLPTSRGECPTEVAPEEEVSQPGHGDEGGAAGGFDPSIQERVDVVTQPSPTGTDMVGGGAGGGPSDPGSGGACSVCVEPVPGG